MKFTDSIVRKFGADKLLHLVTAGWIVSLAGFFSTTCMIIVCISAIVASAVKEWWLDDAPDWMDLIAAVVGILFTFFVYNLA